MIRIFALTLLLLLGVAPAQAQNTGAMNDYTHYNNQGQPDPGTITPLPGGGFQTNYGDGWTQTNVPDDSYGPGGVTVTEKDEKGRVRSVIKYDVHKKRRQNTRVTYNANGSTTLLIINYSATGALLSSQTQNTPAPPPTPPPSGPQSGPTPGPSSGGPPPDSGSGPGGSPFGGFGFGFGVGGGHGEDHGGEHKP